jgi:dihydroorotase
MPNLKPPVTTTAEAAAYRDRILAALPQGMHFKPLMTLYLTDETNAEDVTRGFKEGILTAAKYYPAHATTNAEHGVTALKNIYPVLEVMQRLGMPLLVHGEVTDPEVDVFDREAVFIERALIPLRRDLPGLKIVFEHITTEEAAHYVTAEGPKGPLAATITAHHLMINRNAMFTGGLRPHYYCLPIAKRERHRLALIKAATASTNQMFFLGTDTAPHTKTAKESACGCAGIFSAPQALALYAQVFDEAGKLDRLEAFASLNGPTFYGLPINEDTVTLEKALPAEADLKSILTVKGEQIIPFTPTSPLTWRMAKS